MNLKQLSQEIHQENIDKGFYDGIDGSEQYFITNQLMLVVTEIAEAVEVLRKEGFDSTIDPQFPSMITIEESVAEYKRLYKDKFQAEIADTFIRLFDLCGFLEIDIEKWIEVVREGNKHRGYKHGKKF